MFGLAKKQPSRPEPVKPDDWDQRVPTENTRLRFESSLAWRNVAESRNYTTTEEWSRSVAADAISKYWRDEGPVSKQEFTAQVNGWTYAWRESTFNSFYVFVGAPDYGVPAILTVTAVDGKIYEPGDFDSSLANDLPLQRRLLTPVEFEEFSVPAGPAGLASYQLRDFFNGENTTVHRETVMVFPPLTSGNTEISAATPDPTMVPFIKDQTRLIADTLEVYVPE